MPNVSSGSEKVITTEGKWVENHFQRFQWTNIDQFVSVDDMDVGPHVLWNLLHVLAVMTMMRSLPRRSVSGDLCSLGYYHRSLTLLAS
jgi:hypothetical protein